MNKIRDFLLFFLWLFPVTFSFFPIGTGKIVSIYFLFYLCVRANRSTKRMYLTLSLTLITLVLYISLVTVLTGIYDFSLPYLLTLHLIEFSPGALYFATKYRTNAVSSELLAIYLSISGFLLSSCVFLLLMSPDLRDLSERILPQYGNIDALRITRIRGFSNGGGADHSIQLALTIIGSLFVFMKSGNKPLKLLGAISIVMVLSAIMFVARTGFVLAIGVIISGLFIFRRVLFYKSFQILFILLGITIVFPQVSSTLDFFTEGVFSSKTLPWFLETFSLFTEGSINSSNSQLIDMLFLPHDMIELLFGIGAYSDFGSYRYSDSGFVKLIFSFGLPLTVLYICSITYLIYYSVKNGTDFDKLISLSCVFLLALTVKEPFLLKIGSAHILYLLAFKVIFFNKEFSSENRFRYS